MLNVFPYFPSPDHGNQGVRNYEFSRQIYATLFRSSYFKDGNLRKLCAGMFLALWSVKSVFGGAILNIVIVGSQKQMARIYTRRIIAMVANTKAIWNFSHKHLIANSVGFMAGFPYAKNSVSSFLLSRCPLPTIPKARNMFRNWAIYLNLFPKPFLNRLKTLVKTYSWVSHKQKHHRPTKVLSAHMVPQSSNGDGNVFGSRAFNGYNIARLIIT